MQIVKFTLLLSGLLSGVVSAHPSQPKTILEMPEGWGVEGNVTINRDELLMYVGSVVPDILSQADWEVTLPDTFIVRGGDVVVSRDKSMAEINENGVHGTLATSDNGFSKTFAFMESMAIPITPVNGSAELDKRFACSRSGCLKGCNNAFFFWAL
jgi:hypothetical protein